jgi:hypothetical protein
MLCVSLAAGCSSDPQGAQVSEASTTSEAPDPTPTRPSLEEQQVIWAGEVCVSRDRLVDRVADLGQGLEFDRALDASLLDQLDRQLRWQVLGVASAANDLGTVLVTAPVDPIEANDWVVEFTERQGDLQEAIDRTTGHLDALGAAEGLMDGLVEGGAAVGAASDALLAGQQLVTAAQRASEAAQEEFAPAFAAAPECAAA